MRWRRASAAGCSGSGGRSTSTGRRSIFSCRRTGIPRPPSDSSGARVLPAGSYTGIPADVRHAAAARGETVLQIHGMGPFGIAYVNKADDPAARAAPPR